MITFEKALNSLNNKKQDVLTAGEGISIEDGVISAVGGGGGGTVDAYTKAESDARYLQQHQSLAAYRTSAAQDAIDAGKAAVGSSYTKQESDGRYLTAHQSLSAYRTASAQDTIDSGKMAAFTVGSGLQLVGGVLSLSLPVVTADTEF